MATCATRLKKEGEAYSAHAHTNIYADHEYAGDNAGADHFSYGGDIRPTAVTIAAKHPADN